MAESYWGIKRKTTTHCCGFLIHLHSHRWVLLTSGHYMLLFFMLQLWLFKYYPKYGSPEWMIKDVQDALLREHISHSLSAKPDLLGAICEDLKDNSILSQKTFCTDLQLDSWWRWKNSSDHDKEVRTWCAGSLFGRGKSDGHHPDRGR